ncbi:unnamed protein product [Cuscuta europaea]|uniref:Uncharacterized protein n=1 Tax=Cuscuta europaea TaxID=41803 RepID=A0A9P0YRW8_CUSEU|nr:unnamed protein product [Cuscuta europaea]
MVLHKGLDNNNGFIGYEAPPIPRSTRSTRKRGIIWRKPEVNEQKCAFDLLATIAGNILLEEGQNSPSSANTSSSTKDSIKKEKQNEEETLEHQPCDHGGYERRFFLSELVSQEHPLRDNAEHDTWPSALTTTSSDCSEKLELGSLNRKDGPDVSGTNVSSSCQLGFEFGNGRNDLDLKRQRSLKDYPFKKRKLYDDKNSVSISEAGRSNEDASSYTLTAGTPNPAAAEGGSFRSNDSPGKKLFDGLLYPNNLL